jgi:hypothetical protein
MISQDQRDRRDLEDMQHLAKQEQFTRFLLRVIQRAGIFRPTTDGSREQHLLNEGARQLGLAILDWAEQAQPAAHPDLPIFTLLQVTREEAIQPQQEGQSDEKRRKTDRYDRNAEFDDTDADEDDRR